MKRAYTLIEILIVVAIIGILAIALTSCSGDEDGAGNALRGMGFKDVKLSEPKWMFSGCGKGETNNPFTATNPAGQPVSGIVCCGGFLSSKGCTVRF